MKQSVKQVSPGLCIYLFGVLHCSQHCAGHIRYLEGQREPEHAVGQGSVV